MSPSVTITDPARIPDFERVFGSATVPVRERLPIPSVQNLPEGRREECYFLDLDAITPAQRERLIEYAMHRFAMSRAECEAELPRGFPILASSCVFATEGMDFL